MDNEGEKELPELAKNLKDYFDQASRLIVSKDEKDRNYLKLSHELKDTKEKVREPEARHVICQVLSQNQVSHGIEVPTVGLYRFSGKGKRRALIDLTIFEDKHRLINIELKEGQPSKSDRKVSPIEKDVEKLRKEVVPGSAFFHILQKTDSGTVKAIQKKYASAYKSVKEGKNKGWFLLYVISVQDEKGCYIFFPDISTVNPLDLLKEYTQFSI